MAIPEDKSRQGRPRGRLLVEAVWSSPDQSALIAVVVVLLVGGLGLTLLIDEPHRATPMTGLLILAVIVYGVASGRLSEFSGPGGWRAKFSEAAEQPVKELTAIITPTTIGLDEILHGTTKAMIESLDKKRADKEPFTVTMTFGDDYQERLDLFSPLLSYLATFRNFRGVAVIDRDKRLIAYSPARQIVWLGSTQCTELQGHLLQHIAERKYEDIQNHVLMTNVSVSFGSTFADTLGLALSQNLPGIAVVDDANKFWAIIDRDRLMGLLILSLTRIAQGKRSSPLTPDDRTSDDQTPDDDSE
jgi:hypothetical protein